MEQRNKFSVGEQIEIMKPNGDNVLATVLALVDEDGNEMESCPHPQQIFYVKLSETFFIWRTNYSEIGVALLVSIVIVYLSLLRRLFLVIKLCPFSADRRNL